MSENTSDGVDTTAEPSEAIEFNGEVEALLAERAGYAQYGKTDRVAEVDEQLALRGHTEAAQARAKAAPKGAPKGRSQAPADTA